MLTFREMQRASSVTRQTRRGQPNPDTLYAPEQSISILHKRGKEHTIRMTDMLTYLRERELIDYLILNPGISAVSAGSDEELLLRPNDEGHHYNQRDYPN